MCIHLRMINILFVRLLNNLFSYVFVILLGIHHTFLGPYVEVGSLSIFVMIRKSWDFCGSIYSVC